MLCRLLYPSLRRTNLMIAGLCLLAFGGYSEARADDCGAPSSWSLQSLRGPSGRGRHSIAVDTARNRAVLFGGVRELAGFERPGDTWEWDGTAWMLVDSFGPAGRNDPAMAYHAASGQTILFGGYGPGLFNDTWAWNGASWQQLAVSGPSPRQFHAMAYDPIRQEIVLFGGWAPLLGDTWVFNGTNWTERSVPGPGARLDAKMTWDPVRQAIVLHGGNADAMTCSLPLTDTWAWNGSEWSQIATDGGPGSCGFDMAFDARIGAVVAVMNERTWILGTNGWSEVLVDNASNLPAPRGNHVMWTDPTTGAAMIHGGFPDRNDTWGLAVNPCIYHRDADGDGFGDASQPISIYSTTPPPGYVANDLDCNDTLVTFADLDGDGFGVSPPIPCGSAANSLDCDDTIVTYADTDGDGFGAGAPAPCGVPNDMDLCDSDPGKQAPGVCGCGSPDVDVDLDGRVDCRDVNLHISIAAIDRTPGGLVRLRVEAQTIQPVVEIIGMQCLLQFDNTRMSVVDVAPVGGSPLTTEIFEAVDQGAGMIRYALGAYPPEAGFTAGTALFDVTLQFIASADLCAWTELARFTTFEGAGSLLVARDASSVEPSESWNTYVQLDVTPPTIVGVPAPVAIPFDAGSTSGAYIDAWSYLASAQDACGASIERVISLPDGTTTLSWPYVFPAGTSTIRYRAWDSFGNSSEATTTVTVLAYQLLDATFTLDGSFDPDLPPFARVIRLSFGTHSSLQTVVFSPSGTARVGLLQNVQVPVTGDIPCVQAKDVGFSRSDVGTAFINGVRYSASFALLQGDSNDDDAVDIIDYGAWYIDVGPAAPTGRSNFNSDSVVNNADFAWIGLHFFQRGETCGGFVPEGEPLRRISVKELRRRGLGELAGADVNRDGWLDLRDVRSAASTPAAAFDLPD